ncbi:MAG: redoxin domain-containing protein [Candidatus Coatesbacteria bacterium]|nr:redoxin domain-containing protein [Candidatus Coatesbacteria bacterium]
MRKYLLLALLIALAALVLLGGCEEDGEEVTEEPGEVEDGGEEGEPAAGDKAVDFTALGFDGETYQLSDFEGKLIFLNCFTTWCAPCKEEMPHLVSLAEEYADQGFQLIFIKEDQGNDEAMQKMIDDFGITQPVLLAGQPPLYENDDYWDFYNHGGSVPATFVINADFELIKSETIIGARDEATFRALIEKYLP